MKFENFKEKSDENSDDLDELMRDLYQEIRENFNTFDNWLRKSLKDHDQTHQITKKETINLIESTLSIITQA